MVELKRSPINYSVNEHVTLLHHITKQNSLLEYIEAQVYDVEAEGSICFHSNTHEVCIVALTGRYTVTAGDRVFEHVGQRSDIFEKKPTDSVYVPAAINITITGEQAGRVILCFAPSNETNREVRFIAAADNVIEKRGKYNNRRLVHNILDDQSPISDKLLVVEVYTNAANWSSYPPHKHDQDNLPNESFLEEIYYHEIDPPQGFAFQRVYTEDRLLDETMAVYDGDMVLVPRGYHPVGVPDGYESYYLNIMAGPVKVWKFHNEQDHEWIIHR